MYIEKVRKLNELWDTEEKQNIPLYICHLTWINELKKCFRGLIFQSLSHHLYSSEMKSIGAKHVCTSRCMLGVSLAHLPHGSRHKEDVDPVYQQGAAPLHNKSQTTDQIKSLRLWNFTNNIWQKYFEYQKNCMKTCNIIF